MDENGSHGSALEYLVGGIAKEQASLFWDQIDVAGVSGLYRAFEYNSWVFQSAVEPPLHSPEHDLHGGLRVLAFKMPIILRCENTVLDASIVLRPVNFQQDKQNQTHASFQRLTKTL